MAVSKRTWAHRLKRKTSTLEGGPASAGRTWTPGTPNPSWVNAGPKVTPKLFPMHLPPFVSPALPKFKKTKRGKK